ncbi:MAG: nucleotide-binding protein [Gallionellaceae bacterium]|nr:nucleotide-binding protein [Gallionellaceae bacterium]
MKTLLAICLVVAAPFVWALDSIAAAPAAAGVVKGVVLEVKDVESYTYLRLKTKDGETWAAVGKAPVKKGAEVTVENVMVMTNFKSPSLNKTFPTILFGTLGGAPGSAGGPVRDMSMAHAGIARTADIGDVKVAKASGANARTVMEINAKAAELKDKPVLVRGKVVKFNPEIMGKNWVHLRDGSGSAAADTNDVLVTTKDQAKVGDVVTAKGVVRVNKDFGAGYSYKVLVEEATLQR